MTVKELSHQDKNRTYVSDRPFAWKTKTLIAVKLVSRFYK
jgi:hypothetical protein